MGLLDSLLQQYLNAKPGQANNAQAERHFDQVAQGATPGEVSQGLAAAFRSDQTPDFSQMAAQMFARATPEQQQAILAQMQSMLGANAGAIQGSNVTAGTVQSTLQQAHADDPSILDKMSDFYAQHPGLVKTLGGAALTIALAKMADRARQG